jgi:hypothetical protein
MICPQCKDEGKKSFVEYLGRCQTLAGPRVFLDKEGKEHNHDENLITESYSCNYSHEFRKERYNVCQCGYTYEPERIIKGWR